MTVINVKKINYHKLCLESGLCLGSKLELSIGLELKLYLELGGWARLPNIPGLEVWL